MGIGMAFVKAWMVPKLWTGFKELCEERASQFHHLDATTSWAISPSFLIYSSETLCIKMFYVLVWVVIILGFFKNTGAVIANNFCDLYFHNVLL